MKEYTSSVLKKVQACELMILKDFISICEEHDLTYFAIGGTGIGALRHGGFIPWDDDIDVALPAKDLARLIEIVQRDWSHKYSMINADIDIEYPLATTRMMLKGTEFCEESLAHLPLDLGIFLDLYAFDNVADDEGAYKKQAFDAWFWQHVRMLKTVPKPVIVYHGVKGAVVKALTYTAGFLLGHLGPSQRTCLRHEEEARQRYADVDTKRCAYMNDTDPYNETYYWADVLPVKKLPFCDIELAFPKNLEATLERLYGDYMQLPPVEKRKNHYPARLSFGPYEDIDTSAVEPK